MRSVFTLLALALLAVQGVVAAPAGDLRQGSVNAARAIKKNGEYNGQPTYSPTPTVYPRDNGEGSVNIARALIKKKGSYTGQPTWSPSSTMEAFRKKKALRARKEPEALEARGGMVKNGGGSNMDIINQFPAPPTHTPTPAPNSKRPRDLGEEYDLAARSPRRNPDANGGGGGNMNIINQFQAVPTHTPTPAPNPPSNSRARRH